MGLSCIYVQRFQAWAIFKIDISSFSGSSYTCLAISLERYMGICYPNTSNRFRKLRYYSVAIVLACLLIDTPRFFEVEVQNYLQYFEIPNCVISHLQSQKY